MFDIVPVGHFSIDHISLPERPHPLTILGGSVAYVSLAARRLDARVGIISKIGNDFPEAYKWWLTQEGVDLAHVTKTENLQTTSFELKYNAALSDRTLRIRSKGPPFTLEDLPKSLKSQTVHLAPIAGEITYEVVEKLKSFTKILSLDPQGLLRNFDENGNVSITSLTDKNILGLVDIYKSSLNEIEAATDMSDLDSAIEGVHDCGVKIVIVTLGMEGAILSVDGSKHNIPPCKTGKIVDPTGAGDAFIGGFLAEYINGENCLRCACVGSAVASFVVEGLGPTSFGDKEQIYERARQLYEKEIKE